MQFKAWSFPALALTLGILGAVLGAGIGLLLPAQYTSTARLRLSPIRLSKSEVPGSIAGPLEALFQQGETEVVTRRSLSGLLRDPRLHLYADELREMPLEDVIEAMKSGIDIRNTPGERALTLDVSFTYPNRLQAQQTAWALVYLLQSELLEKSARPYLGADYNRVDVLDNPSLPVSPIFPGRLIAMLCSLLLGVLIAIIWRAIQHSGFIARRFVSVAIAFGVAGLTGGMMADALDALPYRYQSTATLQLPPRISADQSRDLLANILEPASLSSVIQEGRLQLYPDAVRDQDFEHAIQIMKRHLSITASHPGGLTRLKISFTYPDPEKAQQTVQTIMNKIDEEDRRTHPLMYFDWLASPVPDSPPVAVDILEQPSLPARPSQYKHAAFGCLCGVIVAGVIALARRRWKPESGRLAAQ